MKDDDLIGRFIPPHARGGTQPPSSGVPDGPGVSGGSGGSGSSGDSGGAEVPQAASACLRTAPAAPMVTFVQLRSCGGDCTALSYAYLSAVTFDRSGRLLVEFVGHTVSITGVNLLPVFEALRTHTAETVSESPSEFVAQEGEPIVEVITVVGTER